MGHMMARIMARIMDLTTGRITDPRTIHTVALLGTSTGTRAIAVATAEAAEAVLVPAAATRTRLCANLGNPPHLIRRTICLAVTKMRFD